MHRTLRLMAPLALASVLLAYSSKLWSQSVEGRPGNLVAVAPQYDTTHVYIAPTDVDAFVASFLGTFGGKSTAQVVATVTPTPSSTTSQLLQTPSGTVSVFGFKTPVPYPFGTERYGYLVNDMALAITTARASGADVMVTPFKDPIGLDAVVEWPGGVMMQLYWHTSPPSYAALEHVPEDRVYVSRDRADKFLSSFLSFSHGHVVKDDARATGAEVGLSAATIRRISVESAFGKLVVFVTDGHLPYPYGRETTGYEVADLSATLKRAKAVGVTLLVAPVALDDRDSCVVAFPGGFVAEVHSGHPSQPVR